MKIVSLCAVLLVGTCIQCSESFPAMASVENTDRDWSGEYYFYGFGLEASLNIKEEGQFLFSSSTSAGHSESTAGSWVLSGEWMLLSTSIPWIRENQKISRLKLTFAGRDQFLLPEGFNLKHFERGWNLIDTGFVRGGVSRRSVLEDERNLAIIENLNGEVNGQPSWCGTCNPRRANTLSLGDIEKPMPSKSDFDWIVCGETSMADIRSRLGPPAGVGSKGERGGIQRVTMSYSWECDSYMYIREEDLEWEWGVVNAMKLRSEMKSYFDGTSEISEMQRHMIFVPPNVEDGSYISSAGLSITFHESTNLVWHKVFFGPPELDEQPRLK